jgi:hypothetical protein
MIYIAILDDLNRDLERRIGEYLKNLAHLASTETQDEQNSFYLVERRTRCDPLQFCCDGRRGWRSHY